MELVYLWVEDYKNIHRQGFNFSPRFNCSYDDVKNELTIDKNKNYIPDFFGENINVTAIVGKNGSGKSSVFEVLTYLYWQGLIKNEKDKTFFLYRIGNNFNIQCENYKIHSGKPFKDFININNNTKIKSPTVFSARTQMPLISFSNCISDMTHNGQLNNLKTYDKFYNGIQPKDPMMKSKGLYDNFNQKFQYILQENKGFFSFLNENFTFDNYQFELHIYELGAWVSGDELYRSILPLEKEGNTLFRDITSKNHKMYFYRFMALYIISKSEGVISYDDIEQKSRKEKDAYSKEHIFDNVERLFKQKTFDAKTYDEVLDICLKALEPSFKKLEEEVRKSFKREDFSSTEVEKLFKKYTYDEGEIWKSDIFSVKEKKIKDTIKTPLEIELLEAKILRCNFINKKNSEYSFLNLSSGEKLYLNVLTNYAYTLFGLENKYKGVMLFDEIELSFHPDWQKRLLNHLLHISQSISTMKNKNFYLHLLFSSHSPFLLSDLPKENVIFLKDGKEDEGVKHKQTFGQNIHTLLSDSFFMDDGLMGEFAKSKINGIVDFHKEIEKENADIEALKKVYEEKRDKFYQTQSIVGEAYLKQILDNHLLEIDKILLGKDRAKERKKKRLQEEIARLDDD